MEDYVEELLEQQQQSEDWFELAEQHETPVDFPLDYEE